MLAAFMQHRPASGPITHAVRVDMLVMFPIKDRARWGTAHTSKPDKDNVEKAVLDCLVQAKILQDDSLAFTGEFTKVWAERGGLDVRIGAADSQRLAV